MSAELLASLTAELDALWRSPRPTVAGTGRLARQVLREAGDIASARELLRLDASVADAEPRRRVLARSVLAARAAAWMAIHFAPVRPRAEWLVVAALIADAGRLRPGRDIGPADDPAHLGLGASLALRMADAPVELPRLIVRHHERSDGSGFPEGLKAIRLTIEERLLAAAARFAWLFAGDAAEAARRLHEEACGGSFDAELTANFLWSVAGELTEDAGFDRPAPRAWALTDLGRRRLRLDRAHPAMKGPHFRLPTRAASTALVGKPPVAPDPFAASD